MGLVVDRLRKLDCPCGMEIPLEDVKPFSEFPCPTCGQIHRVPVKFGNFHLTRSLGKGAAAEVYQATDLLLHREVAIKVLERKGEGQDAEDGMEATLAEARMLASLNHPHVVKIYSIGEFREQPFIVMELLKGGRIKDLFKDGKAVDEVYALELAIDAAEGLKAASQVGLIHRDVKPGNILLNDQGVAKLVDFGGALLGSTQGDAQTVGTPLYVAPEVLLKQPIDLRIDIYSLGATLFHLLTGRPPFEGTDPDRVMAMRLRTEAPSIQEVDPDLNGKSAEVVARMLLKDPDDRFQDYDSLIEALYEARESVLAWRKGGGARPSSAARPGKSKEPARAASTRKIGSMVAIFCGLFFAAAVAGGVYLITRNDGASTPGPKDIKPGTPSTGTTANAADPAKPPQPTPGLGPALAPNDKPIISKGTLDPDKPVEPINSAGPAHPANGGPMPPGVIANAPADSIPLVPPGALWQFWAGADMPPANWATFEFAAPDWGVDQGGFGFNHKKKDDPTYFDAQRSTQFMHNRFARLHIRRVFEVQDPAEFGRLWLMIRYDDAFVAYVNGKEAARSPNLQGAGKEAKVAANNTPGAVLAFELANIQGLLRSGKNVIGIEVHNSTAGSKDFLADAHLMATPAKMEVKPRFALPTLTKAPAAVEVAVIQEEQKKKQEEIKKVAQELLEMEELLRESPFDDSAKPNAPSAVKTPTGPMPKPQVSQTIDPRIPPQIDLGRAERAKEDFKPWETKAQVYITKGAVRVKSGDAVKIGITLDKMGFKGPNGSGTFTVKLKVRTTEDVRGKGVIDWGGDSQTFDMKHDGKFNTYTIKCNETRRIITALGISLPSGKEGAMIEEIQVESGGGKKQWIFKNVKP